VSAGGARSATTPDVDDLAAVTDLLEQHGCRYWVDSGTLLGLVRAGSLLSWDKDIDLAVLARDLPPLDDLRRSAQRRGFDADALRYRGHPYALSLRPREPGRLRAALHVYYPVGDALFSPQPQMYVPPPAPSLPFHSSPTGRVLRSVMRRWLYPSPDATAAPQDLREGSLATTVARWVFHRIDQGLLADTWPASDLMARLSWVIPSRLVLPLGRLEASGRAWPVPADTDGYLTYRYGDWRTPRRDWWYWRDDGAIRPGDPLQVARGLRAAEGSH
jgi:hypothetical protein